MYACVYVCVKECAGAGFGEALQREHSVHPPPHPEGRGLGEGGIVRPSYRSRHTAFCLSLINIQLKVFTEHHFLTLLYWMKLQLPIRSCRGSLRSCLQVLLSLGHLHHCLEVRALHE